MEKTNSLNMLGRLDIKGYDEIKRVYSTDGISPTLTACGGGNTEVKIFDTNNYRVRKLTPTEYGRLQAFPMTDWEQVVSDSQAYKQFGNAVTVTVVTAIAERLRACLDVSKEITDHETQTLLCVPQEAHDVSENPLERYTAEQLLQELMRRQAV